MSRPHRGKARHLSPINANITVGRSLQLSSPPETQTRRALNGVALVFPFFIPDCWAAPAPFSFEDMATFPV